MCLLQPAACGLAVTFVYAESQPASIVGREAYEQSNAQAASQILAKQCHAKLHDMLVLL
jgi:hypothetical protein